MIYAPTVSKFRDGNRPLPDTGHSRISASFHARAKVGHAQTRYRLFMAGRQSKLTPEIAEAFFNRYKNSSNAAASADACGIGERTLYDWLGHGERQLRGKYRDFLDAFTKLRGEVRDIPAARHRRIALGGIER